jgi:hypothetical protein
MMRAAITARPRWSMNLECHARVFESLNDGGCGLRVERRAFLEK